jgi:hypothetical protein
MTDQPHHPDPKPHATPRWVKMFGIIALVVILLFIVLLLFGGPHRPGRHMHGGDATPVQRGG